jgi:hypothetical protein
VLFFHMTMVPTGMVSACGLKPKPPLLTIVTVIVGGGVGVGLGFGMGVGVGVFLVGVGVGVVLVGVGSGFACVGVTPGSVEVGEGMVAVLVAPTVAVSVPVDAGAFVVGALPPPQPASTMRKASKQIPHKARRRGK